MINAAVLDPIIIDSAVTAPSCPLTPALRRTVVAWIAHQCLPDDAQLAELLFVSPKTVRTHWKRIHKKLGTHSKSAILLVVLQNGWEQLPPAPLFNLFEPLGKNRKPRK